MTGTLPGGGPNPSARGLAATGGPEAASPLALGMALVALAIASCCRCKSAPLVGHGLFGTSVLVGIRGGGALLTPMMSVFIPAVEILVPDSGNILFILCRIAFGFSSARTISSSLNFWLHCAVWTRYSICNIKFRYSLYGKCKCCTLSVPLSAILPLLR